MVDIGKVDYNQASAISSVLGDIYKKIEKKEKGKLLAPSIQKLLKELINVENPSPEMISATEQALAEWFMHLVSQKDIKGRYAFNPKQVADLREFLKHNVVISDQDMKKFDEKLNGAVEVTVRMPSTEGIRNNIKDSIYVDPYKIV
jgi:GTPase Era involved in 16S rRNA processing